MSLVKKIKTYYKDDRGEIIDIFVNEPKDHCSIVSFKKNSVRGNHFHKLSIQSAYILKGDFKICNVLVNSNLEYETNSIEETNASKGFYVTHKEFEAHAYKCLSETGSLIVFTKGIRGGKYYENDTFRLKKKLI